MITFWRFFICLQVILIGCKSSQKNTNSGSILLKIRLIEKETGREQPVPFYDDFNFWFLDSMIICEQATLVIKKKGEEKETRERVIKGYTFIDLPTKSYTIYRTFSDTAQYVRYYKHPDSGKVEGGWNFIPSSDPDKIVSFLSDTIIKNSRFQKILAKRISGQKKEIYSLLFANKDSSKRLPTFFTFNHELTKNIGYPISRLDMIVENDPFNFSSEYVLLRAFLTKKEHRVFFKWKKNLLDSISSKNGLP